MVFLKGRSAETNIIGALGIPTPYEIIRRQLQGKFFGEARFTFLVIS